MVPNKRNYNEFLIDNIEPLTPEQFDMMLLNEIYSLVLIWRLLELKDYFISIEAYEYCHIIQCWFVENNIKFDIDKEEN
jgi:hypothetical protein